MELFRLLKRRSSKDGVKDLHARAPPCGSYTTSYFNIAHFNRMKIVVFHNALAKDKTWAARNSRWDFSCI